jgi:hypothetical protein
MGVVMDAIVKYLSFQDMKHLCAERPTYCARLSRVKQEDYNMVDRSFDRLIARQDDAIDLYLLRHGM